MFVDVYSHSFVISDIGDNQRLAIKAFIDKLVQYEFEEDEMGILRRIPSKVYASIRAFDGSISLHKHLLEDFLRLVRNDHFLKSTTDIRVHYFPSDSDFFKCTYPVEKMHEPRDNQPRILAYLAKEDEPKYEEGVVEGQRIPIYDNIKVVNLQPGGGKTFLAMKTMVDEKIRTAMIMRGGYIDRWIPDLEATIDFESGEIQSINGFRNMNILMEYALEDDFEPAKAYLFTMRTMNDYIQHFEANGVSDHYPIAPHDFFKKLGVGSVIFDEAHQMLHQVCRMVSNFHLKKATFLSATLDSSDPFIDKMLKLMYPVELREDGGSYKAYIHVNSVYYRLRNERRLQYRGYKGSYSHNGLENSYLMKKNTAYLYDYFRVISDRLKTNFLDVYKKGMKSIVFFGTVKMCELYVSKLKKALPKYNVVKYTADDKITVMDDADIIVSTVLSAGTAVDIPNLVYALMTTAINSQQSNEQAKGRLRVIRDFPGMVPVFDYLVCESIPKHVEYDNNKIEFFRGKVKEHSKFQSHITVGESEELLRNKKREMNYNTTKERTKRKERSPRKPRNRRMRNYN